MKSKTNEQALEAAIEKSLTGIDTDELKAEGQMQAVMDDTVQYKKSNRYFIGDRQDYNTEFAVDERRFWHFLETTQEEEVNKLKRHADWKLKILSRLDKTLKRKGILHVLKKGLGVEDAHFVLFYQPPTNATGETVNKRFANNEFSVMRQVPYNRDNVREDIDMVLFLNGLPVVTMELKNQWTGQNARNHGIKQYKFQRDNKQPLLQFARSIVHFAVDPQEAYMTTKLNGGTTFFLPFNKGYNNGKGNPPNPFGHKTAYLWEEVFATKSLANIIQHFILLDGNSRDNLNRRTLFFPRYHQLDVVRKLIADVRSHGIGKRYLIQHSAGSGKSNSITWLAYQLIGVYAEHAGLPGVKSLDKPLFDSVIVVTDRRVLDKQLRENISDFSEMKNIIAPAFKSSQLRKSLEQGKRIIITTIQKFPWIVEELSDQSDKTFAVIIDEAHSSQSGKNADTLNQAMGASEGIEEDEDLQDIILKAMDARKMRSNTSYFAFTATPKNATLEKFGVQQADGKFKEFHLYSMKQAIEEGFILDVLANYTTYKSYYEIQKSVEDNPLFDTIRAQKKLKAFVEKHPDTIATKAEIMIDHFLQQVVRTKKLKGKAKGMVLTQSIISAIQYYQAIQRILEAKGNPFKIVIAFSGTKTVNGIEYTEAQMNGFSEGDTKDQFDTDEYRLLIVANKYLTGFDQPKLTTMYVDKRLAGVMAVQALSRLNRSNDKLGKRTEDIFVLDFFNSADEIKAAFDPFYTSTTLSGPTDVDILHDLKESLDETGVYEHHEVDEFNDRYFRGVEGEKLSGILDVCASRFNVDFDWTDDEKADFKIKAKQFVKIYGQVAAIIPYNVVAWEKLFWFLKFLIPNLIVQNRGDVAIDDVLDSVDLSTYGIERKSLNEAIGLDDSESEVDPQNPDPRGAYGGDEELDELDIIIREFNDRYFSQWDETPENQRVKFIRLFDQIEAHPDYKDKVAENTDRQNRIIALKRIIDEIVTQQRRSEVDFYKLYAQDNAFSQGIQDMYMRRAGL